MNQKSRAMPTRRKLADIRKDNSEQILCVAEKVFAERGYRGATISAIAEEAELPKANVLYYFKSKEGLYRSVLSRQLVLWMRHMDAMTVDQHPREALTQYIKNKIQQSQQHPYASKIFAAEILHGAEFLQQQLERDLKDQFDRTCDVFRGWIAKGWMDPISPEHLIFMLWTSTQGYADHALQSCIMLGKDRLEDNDFDNGIALITRLVLNGCGIRMD